MPYLHIVHFAIFNLLVYGQVPVKTTLLIFNFIFRNYSKEETETEMTAIVP